jgi:hypothetical protein
MNSQELAAILNGREYGAEISRAEEALAKENGLVVLFGASDDLMEFRGAVNDETGVYGGGFAHFTRKGLLTNRCEEEDCPYFAQLKGEATAIGAEWSTEGYSWVYQTTIPHSTFDVLEDGDKYCRGIVFALSDVPL